MAIAVDSYRRLPVPAALRDVAEHAWVARHSGGRRHTEVLLPDGRGLLQVVRGTTGRLVDPVDGTSIPDRDGVRPAWPRVVVAEQEGPVVRLGVQLHPLALARLLPDVPLAPSWHPVTALLDDAVVTRAGDLLTAGDDDGAVGAVLEALAARPRRSGHDLDRLDAALRVVDEHRGLVRQTDVARAAGTSLGELHRWCTQLLGTEPAGHLSAVRFSGFVRETVGAGPVDAAAVVAAVEWFVASGYPAREVERLTGLAPADLRLLTGRLAERVASGT